MTIHHRAVGLFTSAEAATSSKDNWRPETFTSGSLAIRKERKAHSRWGVTSTNSGPIVKIRATSRP